MVIPPWLLQRLQARAAKFGALIFGEHETEDLNVMTDLWRRKLNRLWLLCGPWEHHPTPHRFRHTFARIHLAGGMSAAAVARLMGDSEGIVRKHYSAWIPEHQERLNEETRASQASFEGRHKLVIPGC